MFDDEYPTGGGRRRESNNIPKVFSWHSVYYVINQMRRVGPSRCARASKSAVARSLPHDARKSCAKLDVLYTREILLSPYMRTMLLLLLVSFVARVSSLHRIFVYAVV